MAAGQVGGLHNDIWVQVFVLVLLSPRIVYVLWLLSIPLRGLWRVNCWFCNTDHNVPFKSRGDWLCPRCEQPNCFTSEGDYAVPPVPVEAVNALSPPRGLPVGPEDWAPDTELCHVCLSKQDQLRCSLALLDVEEDEYENNRRHLEQMAALCESCDLVAASCIAEATQVQVAADIMLNTVMDSVQVARARVWADRVSLSKSLVAPNHSDMTLTFAVVRGCGLVYHLVLSSALLVTVAVLLVSTRGICFAAVIQFHQLWVSGGCKVAARVSRMATEAVGLSHHDTAVALLTWTAALLCADLTLRSPRALLLLHTTVSRMFRLWLPRPYRRRCLFLLPYWRRMWPSALPSLSEGWVSWAFSACGLLLTVWAWFCTSYHVGVLGPAVRSQVEAGMAVAVVCCSRLWLLSTLSCRPTKLTRTRRRAVAPTPTSHKRQWAMSHPTDAQQRTVSASRWSSAETITQDTACAARGLLSRWSATQDTPTSDTNHTLNTVDTVVRAPRTLSRWSVADDIDASDASEDLSDCETIHETRDAVLSTVLAREGLGRLTDYNPRVPEGSEEANCLAMSEGEPDQALLDSTDGITRKQRFSDDWERYRPASPSIDSSSEAGSESETCSVLTDSTQTADATASTGSIGSVTSSLRSLLTAVHLGPRKLSPLSSSGSSAEQLHAGPTPGDQHCDPLPTFGVEPPSDMRWSRNVSHGQLQRQRQHSSTHHLPVVCLLVTLCLFFLGTTVQSVEPSSSSAVGAVLVFATVISLVALSRRATALQVAQTCALCWLCLSALRTTASPDPDESNTPLPTSQARLYLSLNLVRIQQIIEKSARGLVFYSGELFVAAPVVWYGLSWLCGCGQARAGARTGQ